MNINDYIKESKTLSRLLRHMSAVRREWESVAYMKQALKDGDALKFAEAWSELDKNTQIDLWVAPSKGGIWTTAERTKMREYSNQLRQPSPTSARKIEE